MCKRKREREFASIGPYASASCQTLSVDAQHKSYKKRVAFALFVHGSLLRSLPSQTINLILTQTRHVKPVLEVLSEFPSLLSRKLETGRLKSTWAFLCVHWLEFRSTWTSSEENRKCKFQLFHWSPVKVGHGADRLQVHLTSISGCVFYVSCLRVWVFMAYGKNWLDIESPLNAMTGWVDLRSKVKGCGATVLHKWYHPVLNARKWHHCHLLNSLHWIGPSHLDVLKMKRSILRLNYLFTEMFTWLNSSAHHSSHLLRWELLKRPFWYHLFLAMLILGPFPGHSQSELLLQSGNSSPFLGIHPTMPSRKTKSLNLQPFSLSVLFPCVVGCYQIFIHKIASQNNSSACIFQMLVTFHPTVALQFCRIKHRI